METLRVVSPLRIGSITLVPIARAAIRSDRGAAGCWIGAFTEPYAIVVRDADGMRALGPDSSEMALDVLIEITPNLGAILSGL